MYCSATSGSRLRRVPKHCLTFRSLYPSVPFSRYNPCPSRPVFVTAVPSPRMLSDAGVFAPNQQVSLSELESAEREIESFKRFDYYFKPPVNKPKVNFDVKNIVLANRRAVQSPDNFTNSSSSSSFYDEVTASRLNGRGTPMLDDFFTDMSLLSLGGSALNGAAGLNIADLGILAGGGGGHGMMRGDSGFIHGLLDGGGEMKSGMVD